MTAWFNTLLSRFRRDEKAAAAVEFALIIPFMITLYMGSLEASALFTADKRVNSISSTVGDLVSQTDPSDSPYYIDSTTLNGYFAAAKGLITPYPTAGVRQVVSLIFVKSDGTTKVLWSRANGTGATARTVNSSFTPLGSTTMMNTISQGGCVIASETTYSYLPLLGQVFKTALTLAHTNYFIPRYGAKKVIQVAAQGSGGLTSTSCTTGS